MEDKMVFISYSLGQELYMGDNRHGGHEGMMSGKEVRAKVGLIKMDASTRLKNPF